MVGSAASSVAAVVEPVAAAVVSAVAVVDTVRFVGMRRTPVGLFGLRPGFL